MKFINLHVHSNFSTFDALGYPQESMEYAYENGMDAIALTDHGNMSGMTYQLFHSIKMNKEGRKIKPIFGVEAYYIDSIDEWKKEKEKSSDKKDKKEKVKGFVSEDETEREFKDSLSNRSHILLLAKNQKGLNNLFELISYSFKNGFYKKPRIDYKILKELGNNIIASSACIGGMYANVYYKFNYLGEEKVLEEMKNLTLKMREIFGKNWYGELQWNSLNEQHIINKLLIKLHHEIDLELISTCDVHYPRPELWESRELYKRLGWLSSKSLNPLPKSVEEIGYELYPKNGDQVFESAKKYSNIANVDYDWAIVSESIEKTYEIAHSIIEDFLPERSIKLPTFIVSSDKSSEETFSQIVWDIFNSSKFANNTIYKERLSKELGVILKRGFAGYFLTMKAISDKAKKMQLVSSGRGCFLKDSKVKMADKSFKNIQDIKKGDSVISHDGSNNIILDLFKYSVSEEIIKIELEDGRIIQCTKEHKILTKNGWKEAEKLNENDEIVEI